MAISNILVADGDSITVNPGPDGQTSWTAEITLNGSWNIHNVAVTSETLATMLANAPTVVDPFNQISHNVVVIWAGTNDFAVTGLTAAANYANLVSYCQGRQAKGWQVIVVDMISRTGTNPVGGETLDADKNAYNALIDANWTTFADGHVVMPAQLTADGAYSNATYFEADGIHPNQHAIDTLEVPAFNAAINALKLAGHFYFIQSKAGKTTAASTFSMAYPANTTAGSVLLALVWCVDPQTISSFTDSVNTWTKVGSTLTPTNFTVNIYVVNSAVGGASTPVLTVSASASNLGFSIFEYAGSFQATAITNSVAGTGTGTAASIGPVTAANGDLLVALGFQAGFQGFTAESTYNTRLTGASANQATWAEDQPLSALGSKTATGTLATSVAWTGLLLDFQPLAFTISGSLGAAGAGATVVLSGAASASTTAAAITGNYSFAGLFAGVYTITPGLTGKQFSPTSQPATITTANVSGVNFTTFTPSQSGSNSGAIVASGPLYSTRIVSLNTSILGTNLSTEIRK